MVVRNAVAALIVVCSVSIACAAEKFSVGQAVQAREGDVWSDVTVQKVEGRRYQIRYADGTEEWVTADRLRASSGGGSPEAVAAPNTPSAQSPGPTPSGGVSLDDAPIQIQLRPTRGVDKRANAPMAVKPVTAPSAAFTNLTPASGLAVGNVWDLSVDPENPSLAIVIGHRVGEDTPIAVIDTTDASKTQTYVFRAPEHNVVCVGDAGKLVVTKPTKWGSNTLHLWELSNGSYQLKANYAFISDGQRKDPNWARLLGPARLLIRSGFGETYLLDIKTRVQLGYLQCGDIRIHCSGRYLLSSKDQSNLILRASDLAIVTDLPGGGLSRLSVDPTGTLAASDSQKKLVVTKVSNKARVSETDGIAGRGDLELIGSNMLLVNGSVCYDLKTGVPVWKYDAPNSKSLMLANGQMLYAGSNAGQSYVCMVALPDPAATAALASLSPDKFALAPGAKVKIEGDLSPTGNADDAKKAVETALKNAGHIAEDSAANYKLAIKVIPGETRKIALREHQRMGPPITREYDAPSTVVLASLTLDGQELWTTRREYRAQVVVTTQGNETIQQAIDKAGKCSPQNLAGLDIPPYVVKGASPGAITTLGESALTMEGFKAKGK